MTQGFSPVDFAGLDWLKEAVVLENDTVGCGGGTVGLLGWYKYETWDTPDARTDVVL